MLTLKQYLKTKFVTQTVYLTDTINAKVDKPIKQVSVKKYYSLLKEIA